MLNKVTNLGIVQRFALVSTGLAVVLILIMTTILQAFSKNLIELELEKDGRFISNVLASEVETSLEEKNLNQLKQKINLIVQENSDYLEEVKIVDHNQSLIYSQKNNFNNFSAESDDAVLVQKFISSNDQDKVLLSITLSKKRFTNEVQKAFNILIFILILLVVVFAFFATYFSKIILTNPMNTLLNMVRSYNEKNLRDYISTSTVSELKEISEALHLAYSTIENKEAALKAYATKLEDKIATRTKELDLQKDKLVNASKMAVIGELSAGVAHEINNPLAAISAYSYLIQKSLDEQKPDLVKSQLHLSKITHMVERISKIVTALRSFARDGSKDTQETMSVNYFLDDLYELCSIKLKNRDIKFSYSTGQTQLEIKGHIVQLSQVFANLINNSIDAIEQNDEKWIDIRVEQTNGYLVFTVKDSGKGIRSDIAEKIMQPFFTTKKSSQGTGLGLSISQSIIQDHNGKFYLDQNSANTTFVIELPL